MTEGCLYQTPWLEGSEYGILETLSLCFDEYYAD